MSNNISTGNAGEYFVAGELERHGLSAAVPMSNTELFDILAFNRESHNQYAIQVKTSTSNKKEWILSKKNENIQGKNIYYVFVLLNGLDNPEYHIVPSNVIAEEIKKTHQVWINTPGKKGQKHNDNDIRKFKDDKNTYLDKWDHLI